MRVCAQGNKWAHMHLRYPFSFAVQAPALRLHSTGQVVPTPTMETESDDDPQGSTAAPSCTTRTMCGDLFDRWEVGTFPIGRLSPLHPLPLNAVNEQAT